MANALREAESLGFDTVQVFTKNQRQWKVPALKDADRDDWLAELSRLGWKGRAVSHDAYLINLASPDDSKGGLRDKSLALMREELLRCEALGIPLLVSHPGAHMIKDGATAPDDAVEQGLRRIASAYKQLFRETRGHKTVVCLENTAGGGTTLGRTFEELARCRELILSEAGPDAEGRVGFCLDTCHALAAGYDIASHENGDGTGKKRTKEVGEALGNAMLDEFDRLCALEHLRVLHLNDSLGARASRRDRHAHIGKGLVAVGAFSAVVNSPELAGVPKILETPKENDARGTPMDRINLRRLKSLFRRPESGDEAGMKPAPRPNRVRRGPAVVR